MLKITAYFDMNDIEAYIDGEMKAWLEELVESFRITGRNLVKKARAKTKAAGGFGNITWNLRSSIGYCLMYDGEVIEVYFPSVGRR